MFLGKGADSEVSEDSVGECVEFSFVDDTWVLGVNLSTLSFNPSPVSSGWGVVLRGSDMIKSDLDFILRKGTVVVGIKFCVFSIGLSRGDTDWSLSKSW